LEIALAALRAALGQEDAAPVPQQQIAAIDKSEGMLDRLEKVKERYDQITALLSDFRCPLQQERFRELSKEHSDLTPLIRAYDGTGR